jgi:hypothetical protein
VTRWKAGWIDPADHVPSKGTVVGASGQELVSIKQRFGAQLRAATAVARSKSPAKPATPAVVPTTKPVGAKSTSAPTEEEARVLASQSDADAKFDGNIPF